MKVLFAVSNENISKHVVQQYQKKYKEIISYKNVYYFNAILKEIQKVKTYDRIVISEGLEQFTNTNYQQMDKFIFDRLDSISDEASNEKGENIPIILLCSERRTKGEEFLTKLFGIGIYDAIIGKDRDISEVCDLIYRPRSKRDAKEYYRIESDDVNYQAENENDVTEVEIQNILAHYKRLGKNEEKYVESFNNIASQYNDVQLKIICKFLPLNVRAVLEESSPKYQQLMAFNKPVSGSVKTQPKRNNESSGTSEKLLTSSTQKTMLSKPVIIPSSVKSDEVKKYSRVQQPSLSKNVNNVKNDEIDDDLTKFFEDFDEEENKDNIENEIKKVENIEPQIDGFDDIDEIKADDQPKRGRGRPKKILTEEEQRALEEKAAQPKRGRGRPKKITQEEQVVSPEIEEEATLPGFDDFEEQSSTTDNDDFETILPGFEDVKEEEEDTTLPGFDDSFDTTLDEEDDINNDVDFFSEPIKEKNSNEEQDYIKSVKPDTMYPETNINDYETMNSNLYAGDKKVVTFVGTSKNGTSFILNNLAELLSSQGINVAILDTTKNKNSYYIYTKNDESLRKISYECIENLTRGISKGIRPNNNLTVYTTLPGEDEIFNNVDSILNTLIANHSVVLIDADFNTPYGYFANAHELYLVQSMDVLTIQPLTEFLNKLKSKNLLNESKIRIVINKHVRLRNVTEKAIIGGMSMYNDPAMSYMNELFNRNTVRSVTIPFEENVYAKYLEGLVNCDITLKGYSKVFMQSLKQLENVVYPLISDKGTYAKSKNSNYQQQGFTSSMRNTLDQMKKKY